MSWPERELNEVADFLLGKMLDQKKNKGDPLPYLANVNVRWGTFELDNLREMRFEPHEKERFGLRDGDIVMCEGGEPGRCAIWNEKLPDMMFQKALHRIRPHKCLDNKFLYYTFLQKGRKNGFQGLFTGSTIKHLPKEKLAKVKVEVPPLSIQRRIAEVLTNYDDLIENNKRRIALLEEAARLLYREWFVHYRFPGHEHVKIIDGVPEGWKQLDLFDAADALYGFAFKSKQFNEEGEGIPVVRIRDIPEGISKTYTLEEAPKEKLLKDGDFLIGMDGIFHQNFWVGGRAWINQRVVRISSKCDISNGYLRQAVRKPIEDFNETIAGTTVAHLGAKHLKVIKVLLPPRHILNDANEFLESNLKQFVKLSKQNQELIKARDLLIPRLMDGRVEV